MPTVSGSPASGRTPEAPGTPTSANGRSSSNSNGAHTPPPGTSVASSPEALSLMQGHNCHMFFVHPSTGTVVRQWAHLFFVPADSVEAAAAPATSPPGALYFATKPGDRTLRAQQSLPLVSISEMSGSQKASPAIFKSPVGLAANPECCATITATAAGMAWNLELIPEAGQQAKAKETRDTFLKNIHKVMMLHRAATGSTPVSSPAPITRASSGSVSMTPAVMEELRLMREGQNFVRHTVNAAGALESKHVLVWFVDDASCPSPGTLFFVALPGAKLPGDGRFPLQTVQTMAAGKESALLKSALAKALPAEKCMSVVSGALTLDLEAPDLPTREVWIKALHGVMVRHGRRAVEQRALSAAAASAVPARSSVSGGTGVQAILSVDEQLNTLQQGLPLTVFYGTPKGETLAADINLFLVVPLVIGATMPAGPCPLELLNLSAANLHWCAASTSANKVIEGQKLPVATVREMKAGKDSTTLKHELARGHATQRCFQVVGAQLTLNLSAQTPEAREKFMLALDGLIKKIKASAAAASVASAAAARPRGAGSVSTTPLPEQQQQFVTMVSTTSSTSSAASPSPSPSAASPHPNPMSPNSPASPAVPSARPALTAVDHKTAVALLQHGQTFTLYSTVMDATRGLLNEPRKESITVFFAASNGVDSPGTLHYMAAGAPRVQNDRSRTFYLNQIKQMRAGRETPIFRSAIAVAANVNHCLTLFSPNAIWNLEAPSGEVREAWMKSLHQVLIRHGMKATDDEKKRAASVASGAVAASPAPTGSPAASPSLSSVTRALPAQPLASSNNRTINFSDPTAFFELQSKIGEGSYGSVYKAIDIRDGMPVAIKVLPFQGRDSLKLRKEIHILKQLNSPYIVGYKGAFQKSSNVWIVMSYAAGGALSDIMQICQRTFSEAQVALIMKHSLAGLAYLHSQRMIHRDIKGGNILVSEAGHCMLADFGVSSNIDKTLGKNRTVIGTPHWMAPEVLCNDDYNEKADIWSLGITAYELVIGEPPHSKLHSMRAAIKIPTSPPPTLPDPHRFSADFHSFLAAALVKDFETRPSALTLLQHPFILKAPPPSILDDNVRAAMIELESKHESMDEINALVNNSSSGPRGSRNHGTASSRGQSMRGVSSTRDSSASVSELDASIDPTDFDNEMEFSDTMVPSGASSSDTMLVGATMIAAGPPSGTMISGTMMAGEDEEDDTFNTMLVSGPSALSQLSRSIIISATERSGIGSRSPGNSSTPTAAAQTAAAVQAANLAAAVASVTAGVATTSLAPEDEDLGDLDQFETDEDDEDDDGLEHSVTIHEDE